jgi:hypothetical protein
MSDVICMVGHADHYLATFDKDKAIGLYDPAGLALFGQRIMFYTNRCEGCALLGNW